MNAKDRSNEHGRDERRRRRSRKGRGEDARDEATLVPDGAGPRPAGDAQGAGDAGVRVAATSDEAGGEEDVNDEGDGPQGDDDGRDGDSEGDDGAAPPATMGGLLREYYLTFDRRTLGFTRILLGLYLIGDLFRRTGSWLDMFSDLGVLPSHVHLWRSSVGSSFSLLHAFSSPGELWVLWAIILATYVGLLVGFKTKLMQILAMVFVTSMNGRVGLIENGGYTIQNLLMLWTCFLPLGDRFSIDSLRRSLKRSHERIAAELNDRDSLADPEKPDQLVTLVGAFILIQIAAIYFFNVLHKTGPNWKNGTAVHYVIYVDRMVTPLVADVRDHIPNWLFIFLTKTALAFEAAVAVCLFSPLGRVWARRAGVAIINALHLGFGTVFVLGPFAWAMCVFSTVLFGREDWEIAYRTMRRSHRARTVLFDPGSPGALFACRVLKRIDRFTLLTFEASTSTPQGLAIRKRKSGAEAVSGASRGGAEAVSGASRGGAEAVSGADALADVVAALPLGPIVAWIPRLPLVRGAITAAMAAMYRRDLGRALGLRTPGADADAAAPSPLRRKVRRALAVGGQLIALVMFVALVNQAMVELWVVNRRIKVPQPEPLWTLANKLRFRQGWFMFSPNPVMDDGTIVVDAVTIDGRHIDPFTGKPPNFDLIHAKSFGYNQIWSDYFNRIQMSGNAVYHDAMKQYMYRYPERTGRPEDAIVSGDVYWVKDWNPKWGRTESYGQEQNKLFSFQNPKLMPPGGAEPQPGGAVEPQPGGVAAPPPGGAPQEPSQ